MEADHQPDSMTVAAEAEQISVSVKQPDEASALLGIDNIEEPPSEMTVGVEGDIATSTAEGDTEAGEDLMTTTEATTDRERRLKRREEKKRAREILDRHYRQQAQEQEEPMMGTTSLQKIEEGEEGDGDEGEGGDAGEEAASSLEENKELKRLESSLIGETEDLRTGIISSSDEDDYRQEEREVSFKADFLQYFYLPSMSDLSTDSSDHRETEFLGSFVRKEEDTSQLDKGKFVNPLTGETESSTPDEEKEEPINEEAVEEESSSSTSEFEWPFDDDDEAFKVQPMIEDVDDIALEMFLEVQPSTSKIRDESTTAIEAAKQVRETRQIAIEFVYKIIDQVVETAEYVDPVILLRGKLDKSKLMAQLQRLYSQFLVAKQYNVDVNNKMFDYYRRMGQTRSFDVLPAKVEQVEYKRYMDAMSLLDHLKMKANETKKKNSEILAHVKLDLDYVHNYALTSVDALEQRIRDVLLRKDAEYLPRIVENELRRMQQTRNEISDSRLWLITSQHTLGRLVERKRKFDQITEDLTMDQYLMAQRDVTALGTKVEERNNDLNRMRDRCTKHMHQLAFIREKTSLTLAALVHKSLELSEKMKRRSRLRDQLLKLKLQHASLMNQKSELYEKCGILYKPALLHDYDETVDYIEVKREAVAKLKATMQDLEARIVAAECH